LPDEVIPRSALWREKELAIRPEQSLQTRKIKSQRKDAKRRTIRNGSDNAISQVNLQAQKPILDIVICFAFSAISAFRFLERLPWLSVKIAGDTPLFYNSNV
jgi:hypothetical protein